MQIGTIFWVLMILWAVLGYVGMPNEGDRRWYIGGNLMLFILLFLLGWKAFGFVVQG